MTNSYNPPDPLLSFVCDFAEPPTLEEELTMEKQLVEIREMEDVQYLRNYAEAMTRQNFHQSHFIASCLERVAALQARIVCLKNPVKQKERGWLGKLLGL